MIKYGTINTALPVGSWRMDCEIVVRGQGELRVMPDRAVFRVVVESDGNSRDEAYHSAGRLTAAVDAALSAMAGATARVVTTTLAVQPRSRWRKGENVSAGWRASRTSSVEVVELGRVGEFVAAVGQAGASVIGPNWELDAANDAWNQVRRLAAQDARRRAESYTDALNLPLGPVAWIAEPGLRGLGPGFGAMAVPGMAAAAAGRSLAEEPIEVAVEELTLTAAVEVGFSLKEN